MPDLRTSLFQFLDQSARRRFEWGVCDCVLEVADWLDRSLGLSIADEYRGTYSDEAGARAILGPGGIEGAMSAKLAEIGLAETREPQFGDVAVVAAPGQGKPLAAILMPSGRWRMKTERGIALSRGVTVMKAWSVR
jgi:hypothetical protein